MILDELELKQRYNDYLREVRQEQLYQQVKANQSNLLQRTLMGLGDLFNHSWTTFKSHKLFLNRFPKGSLRPFKIGDRVVHPNYGVGTIVIIKEKQFSGKRARLYYEVALPKLMTLWVPVEAQLASGLQLVTIKSKLDPATP